MTHNPPYKKPLLRTSILNQFQTICTYIHIYYQCTELEMNVFSGIFNIRSTIVCCSYAPFPYNSFVGTNMCICLSGV